MWLRATAIAIVCLGLAGYVSATIAFVQVNSATPSGTSVSVPVTFGASQTAGNLNIIAVGWNDATSNITAVTDTRGNTYVQAGTTVTGTALRQAIYYAKNIAAGTNTVTVTFNTAASIVDLRALEYSGLDQTSPLDVTAGAAGTSGSPNSGAATTIAAGELVFGAGTTLGGFTAPGAGFTTRIITLPDGDIAEDLTAGSSGSQSASGTLSAPNNWVMQMATFKASTIPPPPNNIPLPQLGCIADSLAAAKGGKHPQLTESRAATLTWTGTADWFRVYRGSVSGGPYTLLADCLRATTYTDTAVQDEQIWFYTVTGVTNGVETTVSGEVQGAIPPQSTVTRTLGPPHRNLPESLTTTSSVVRAQVLRRSPVESAPNILTFGDSSPEVQAEGSTFYYVIVATNGFGVSTTTNELVEIIPITGLPHTVTLNWLASPTTDVGYKIERSTVSGGPYSIIGFTGVAVSPLRIPAHSFFLTEPLTTLAIVSAGTAHTNSVNVTDNLSTASSVAAQQVDGRAPSDSLTTSSTVNKGLAKALPESLTTTPTMTARQTIGRQLTDAVSTIDALSVNGQLGARSLSESIPTTAVVTAQGVHPRAISEILSTLDSLSVHRPLSFRAFSESLTTAAVVAGVKNITGPSFTESLITSDTVSAQRSLHIQLAEALTTSDALVRQVIANRTLSDSAPATAIVNALKVAAARTIWNGTAVYSGTSTSH